MKQINSLIERFFPVLPPIPAGMYQYQSAPEENKPYRMQLRLEPDGTGLLILNASTVMHLNQTAAEIAYHLIQKTPENEAVDQMVRRYKVSRDEAQRDLTDLKADLLTLVTTSDLDPVTYLGIDRTTPYSKTLTAPYRIDCAITYQTSSGDAQVAPVDRVRRELQTEEWKTALGKAWEAGVPHVIFTGGEPTLRGDLFDLIAFSEQLGMVAGLLTDGTRLTEKDYLHNLLQSGLDHLMLLLNPQDEQSWEALRDLLHEDLFTTVHLTIDADITGQAADLIERLGKMGVQSLSLSTADHAYDEALTTARETAANLGIELVWDLPVPYSKMHPVAIEQNEENLPEGAGKAWVYVEPDGDVLAAQGYPQVLGNLLENTWAEIWHAR